MVILQDVKGPYFPEGSWHGRFTVDSLFEEALAGGRVAEGGGWSQQVWALTAPPGGHCCPAAGLRRPGKRGL